MQIFNYDDNGFFTGEAIADESPLEPGQYLIPAKATIIAPPLIAENQAAKFNGEKWEIIDLVDEVFREPEKRDAAAEVRQKRDALLLLCDWVMLPDAPIKKEKAPAWKAYRQTLRDIPQQNGFPEIINWPEAPK